VFMHVSWSNQHACIRYSYVALCCHAVTSCVALHRAHAKGHFSPSSSDASIWN